MLVVTSKYAVAESGRQPLDLDLLLRAAEAIETQDHLPLTELFFTLEEEFIPHPLPLTEAELEKERLKAQELFDALQSGYRRTLVNYLFLSDVTSVTPVFPEGYTPNNKTLEKYSADYKFYSAGKEVDTARSPLLSQQGLLLLQCHEEALRAYQKDLTYIQRQMDRLGMTVE